MSEDIAVITGCGDPSQPVIDLAEKLQAFISNMPDPTRAQDMELEDLIFAADLYDDFEDIGTCVDCEMTLRLMLQGHHAAPNTLDIPIDIVAEESLFCPVCQVGYPLELCESCEKRVCPTCQEDGICFGCSPPVEIKDDWG